MAFLKSDLLMHTVWKKLSEIREKSESDQQVSCKIIFKNHIIHSTLFHCYFHYYSNNLKLLY